MIKIKSNKMESFLNYYSKKFFEKQKNILSKIYFPVIILSLIQICSQSNEITIKISGVGVQFIVNENYNYCPSSISSNNNGITLDSTNCKKINIPEGSTTNTIKFSFDETITSFQGIFANLTNLIEVDLSNFDTSTVNDMKKYVF